MPIQIVHIISGSILGKYTVRGCWEITFLCILCYFLPDASLVVSNESLLLISMDIFVAAIFHFVPNSSHVHENKPYREKKTLVNQRRFATATFIAFILVPASLCLSRGLPSFMVLLYLLWKRRTRNSSNSYVIPNAVENTSLGNLYEGLPLIISLFVWFHSFAFLCEIWQNQPLQFLQEHSIHSNLYVACTRGVLWILASVNSCRKMLHLSKYYFYYLRESHASPRWHFEIPENSVVFIMDNYRKCIARTPNLMTWGRGLLIFT